MLLRAIIENKEDSYHYRIRIPVLNKSGDAAAATPYEQLYVATVCTFPGVSLNFVKGDAVFVAFEKDLEEYPVIMGQLSRETQCSSSLDITADSITSQVSLDVNGDFNLKTPLTVNTESADSTIGGDIKETVQRHTSQIASLNTDMQVVEEDVGAMQIEVDTMREEVTAVVSDMAEVKSNIIVLTRDVSKAKSDINSLKLTKQDLIKYGSITLYANKWVASERVTNDEYQQQVDIPELTDNCIVNLLPDYTTLNRISEDGTTAVYIGNDGTNAYAYALTKPPLRDVTIQYTVSDVKDSEE